MATHDYPACAVFRGGRCTCDQDEAPTREHFEQALPELCQTGGLASRICQRGTKGCTVDHVHHVDEASDGNEA